jgi:histidinol-phosphate phosphatase family protein
VQDLCLLRNAVPALRLLKDAGFKLIMVTNQSGIGRGYFTETTLLKIHAHLQNLLRKKGVPLDAIYYCPHAPGDECSCRKPALGMVRQARRDFTLDLKRSFTVGDHPNDVLLGENMGGTGIFVLTGHGKEEYRTMQQSSAKDMPKLVVADLLAAARLIVKAGQ